jgi:hypothetical protein
MVHAELPEGAAVDIGVPRLVGIPGEYGEPVVRSTRDGHDPVLRRARLSRLDCASSRVAPDAPTVGFMLRTVKRAINKFLARTTGHQLTKVIDSTDPGIGKPREVPVNLAARNHPDAETVARLSEVIGPSLRPVVVLSPKHDGLTALRRGLEAHPNVHVLSAAPLAEIRIRLTARAERRLADAGVGLRDLEHMLWDQLLRDQLARSGRGTVALADPGLAPLWSRLKDAWPAAHFVYLLRDPAQVWASRQRSERGDNAEADAALIKAATAVDNARTHVPGFTIRHEELIASPDAVLGNLCEFIGLPPDAGLVMALKRQLDGEPPAAAGNRKVPRALKSVAESWGYR